MSSDDAFAPCSTCGVERLASTLDDKAMCPFCVEEGKDPPRLGDKYPQVTVRPAPPPNPPPPPFLTSKETVEAASYLPPQFDQAAASASPQREIAMRELCRRRFLPFVQRFRPKYMAGWVHEDICRRLERFVEQVEQGLSPRLLLMMPPRSGKLLADDTLVPTPRGWRSHGQLRPGDEVFHPSGRVITVVAISPKDVADVRVAFSDGSSYLCHENHEWVLFDRKRGEWKTLEAGHFLRPSHLGKPPRLRNGARAIYQLPPVAALEYPGDSFTLHPYALGAWLGDGSVGKPCITGAKADKAIISRLEAAGYPVSAARDHPTTGVLPPYFGGPRPNVSGRMTTELQRLGIYKQKRIPAEYQRLRTDLRLELLAGLIDTDGTTDKNSRISITTVSHELAGDIMQLCSGLGFRPYMQEVLPTLSSSGIQGRRVCYVVGFQPTCDIPVALVRKRVTRVAPQRRVGLVSVERVPAAQVERGNCIKVDAPDGLYVIGTTPAATHNSELGSRHLPPWIMGKHPDWEIIAASHTSSLTLSFSRYVRDVIRDPAYKVLFPEMQLDPGSQSVENWNTLAGGGYLAAGVGTGITGRGAHVLLLDDLVKDIEAADSVTIKENTWEWYGSTAYTRLAPGGGVLGIMCMTGDTPVMMADGTTRPLAQICRNDQIATYENGRLTTSRVDKQRNVGPDSVLKITTSSGRVVRANGRHPFLATTATGELKWVRARALSTQNRIATLKASGESGKEWSVLLKGARSQSVAEDCAPVTTARKSGLMGIVARARSIGRSVVRRGLSTAMALLPKITTGCTPSKTEGALFAKKQEMQLETPNGGKTSSPSIIAMTPGKSGAYSATTATQELDILELSPSHLPLHDTSDFTLEQIVSIEPDGIEDVFDIQVDRTTNFIANGVVSSNTWWNEDDWAGRIQQVMESGEGDVFEVVKYPALNEEGDEYILWKEPGEPIVQIKPGMPVPDGAQMTRPIGTALHPARYTTEAMNRIKRNLISSGQRRVWNALYQQNPTPDDGVQFTKEMVQYFHSPPQRHQVTRFQAWDFAITESQTSDYSVCVTMDQDEHNSLYVVDVLRFRSDDGNAIVEYMIDQIEAYGPDFLGVEDGQIWKALRSQFETRCIERQVFQAFEVLQPLTDKIVRASPLKGRMQLKKVFIWKDKPWTDVFVRELMVFPGGKNDDQVDAAAWCARLTMNHMPKKPPAPKKLESWRDKLRGLSKDEGASHMAA